MIQACGRTYRIVEIAHSTYRVVRIADEVVLGAFHCGPKLQLWSHSTAATELREVARSAMRSGRTRWHSRVAGPAMRTYATFALGAMLGLASCSGSPPPATAAPVHEPAAPTAASEPAAPPPATDLKTEERSLPDMPPSGASLDRVMHAHFHDALLIRQAVIAGTPEQAVAPARVLSVVESEESWPPRWREPVARMQKDARRIGDATSAAQAAAATADMAAACGQCHRRLGGPRVCNAPPPPTGTTVDQWMKRHQWASDRLWEGIVTPSTEAWAAGIQAFGKEPLPEELTGDGTQARQAAAELASLIGKASQRTGLEERAALYAELLATCASCHRAVKHRRTE